MTICRTPIPDPRVERPAYYLVAQRDGAGGCPVSYIHYRFSFVAICWLALRWWWCGCTLITIQAVSPLPPGAPSLLNGWKGWPS